MVDLRGLRVLVTRPGQRGEALSEAIRAAGGSAVHFPAMQIAGISDSDGLRALARSFPRRLLAVFISPNAATFGRAWLHSQGLWDRVVTNQVAAVGGGTAQLLRDFGIADLLSPHSGSGGAALLELPELASLRNTQVVLFRGVGGKEDLARQLTARGARLRSAEVYRRVRPATRLTAQRLAGVDIVTTSSREGLENLYALAEPAAAELLRRLPLLVSSAEAARSARTHGQRISPIITPQSNERILEELERWRTNRRRKATPPGTAN